MFPHILRSSGSCVRNAVARTAIGYCKSLRRIARLSGLWRDLVYWPTCWYRNTEIICHCIGSRTSTIAKAWICRARRWRIGSVARRVHWNR
jgi:hypothetical protein